MSYEASFPGTRWCSPDSQVQVRLVRGERGYEARIARRGEGTTDVFPAPRQAQGLEVDWIAGPDGLLGHPRGFHFRLRWKGRRHRILQVVTDAPTPRERWRLVIAGWPERFRKPHHFAAEPARRTPWRAWAGAIARILGRRARPPEA